MSSSSFSSSSSSSFSFSFSLLLVRVYLPTYLPRWKIIRNMNSPSSEWNLQNPLTIHETT